MRQEDKLIPTIASVVFISSVKLPQGEWGGPVAGRLEGNEVPCRRWQKEAGRKAEGFAGRALHPDSSPKSSEEPYIIHPPGDFHFHSFSLKISMVGPLYAGLRAEDIRSI